MRKFREDLFQWIRFYSRKYRRLLGRDSTDEDARKFAAGLVEHIEKGRVEIVQKPDGPSPTTPKF